MCGCEVQCAICGFVAEAIQQSHLFHLQRHIDKIPAEQLYLAAGLQLEGSFVQLVSVRLTEEEKADFCLQEWNLAENYQVALGSNSSWHSI